MGSSSSAGTGGALSYSIIEGSGGSWVLELEHNVPVLPHGLVSCGPEASAPCAVGSEPVPTGGEDNGHAEGPTDDHDVTHLTKRAGCEVCDNVKVSAYPAKPVVREESEVPSKFGDKIHCDHMHLRNADAKKVGPEKQGFYAHDEGTGVGYLPPVADKSSDEVSWALQRFVGKRAHNRFQCKK